MLGQDDVPVAQQGGTLQDIAQLAHVARVVVTHQAGQSGWRQPDGTAGRHPRQQGFRQQGHVIEPLAQRGQADREGVQTEIEILTEAPLLNHRAQIAVRGGNQAHVRLEELIGADAPEGTGLQQPQQLHLHPERNVAEFVEEERAAPGRLDQTDAPAGRAGERSFLMTEQLAFEQRLGQTGAIDRDERPLGAAARIVDRLRDELLAGAGLALQHGRRIGRSNAGHLFEHAAKCRRAADQRMGVRLAVGSAERLHLLDEISDVALLGANRRQLDVDIGLAVRRMMQMQDALAASGSQAAFERTGLAGLVARGVVAVRHRIAGLPLQHLPSAELAAIGLIRRQDAVFGVAQDVGFGKGIEIRDQLCRWLLHDNPGPSQ